MVDFNYIVPTGVIVPDTSELRADVEGEWKSAFGQDLVVTSETPQGVMITAEVESRDATVRNNAELANQINPDIAGGIFLDAIWRLTRGNRRPATRSTMTGVEFRGIPSTIIPAGSYATVEATGAQFQTLIDLVIGSDGLVVGDMLSEDAGPIAAPIGGLNQVASSVLGWEQVYNPIAAVPGSLVESDVASRRRRRQTLALQSVSLPEAITSRLYNIDGVRSLSFRENITNDNMVIDGITLAPHSIYVCIEGGTDTEVATALLNSKSGGANWNGSIAVGIIEPFSKQSYTVRFDRPIERQYFARITVRSTSLDAQTIIPAAIAAYTAGELDGDTGLVIGADVSPFELSGAINEVEPRIFVAKVEISTDGVNWSSNVSPVAINEVARLPESAIQVVII